MLAETDESAEDKIVVEPKRKGGKAKKIAAVIIILAIFVLFGFLLTTGMLDKLLGELFPTETPVSRLSCVPSPVNEIVSGMNTAMSGIDFVTTKICLKRGNEISFDMIENRLSNVDVSFKCDAEICADKKLVIMEDRLSAKIDVEFKAKITCDVASDEGHTCDITILDLD
ncbi:MAG: hypothetical protein JXB14_02955 [Candidatus Altiarchaeota archaeon]|nr:hypothetical protein [Candidatus Altiarchaeota archaeon]